jgi:hypothetical protein
MGVTGAPNFSLTSVRKSASRRPSHRQKLAHTEQAIRFAWGPPELPMMPMLQPQFEQGRGSCTLSPMSGDIADDDGAASLGDDGKGGDSKKSSCCTDVTPK